eukprot:1688713-Prorocentrum_lima.AAC.1
MRWTPSLQRCTLSCLPQFLDRWKPSCGSTPPLVPTDLEFKHRESTSTNTGSSSHSKAPPL